MLGLRAWREPHHRSLSSATSGVSARSNENPRHDQRGCRTLSPPPRGHQISVLVRRHGANPYTHSPGASDAALCGSEAGLGVMVAADEAGVPVRTMLDLPPRGVKLVDHLAGHDVRVQIGHRLAKPTLHTQTLSAGALTPLACPSTQIAVASDRYIPRVGIATSVSMLPSGSAINEENPARAPAAPPGSIEVRSV